MNITKYFVVVLLIIAAAYTTLTTTTLSVLQGNTLCTNSIVRILAPWSAGCFYTAYFENANTTTKEQLEFEKNALEKFILNGGLATDILWYRSVFHQKYQNYFRTPYQDIHEMHLDYTRSEHIRIDIQAAYLSFLFTSELINLAQQTLNNYCSSYITKTRNDLVEEIRWRLRESKMKLSLHHCESIVGISSN